MIGNIRWNFTLASFGLVITILLSLMNNVWLTSLYRGLYCFIILFAISYIPRWVLAQVMDKNLKNMEPHKGKHIDFATPDEQADPAVSLNNEGETADLQEDGSFAPLDPPRFMSKEESDIDAEQVVSAIRHMSEGEGR